jgi:glycosyltransferase involved in cell wall biosynthesis
MGGAETWLMEVLRQFSANSAGEIDFLVTSGNAGLFDDEARRLGSRIYYLRYSRRNLGQFAAGYRRVLSTRRYHAIHDHQDFASGWHLLLGRGLLPAVSVTHVHNPSYQIRNNYGVSTARRLTGGIGKRLVARYATHIAATSAQVIDEYGLNAPAFDHIPKAPLYCGFSTARFLGDASVDKAALCREMEWRPDARIVLVVGRIDQSPNGAHPQTHKNSGFAVDVGIEAACRDERVHMLLAGAKSPAVPTLESRIADAGLAGRIRFAGIRKDVEHLMIASDALLFPSRGEGLGMVAVEAQAAGLPVLASSAVPRECIVVPGLINFLDVSKGPSEWASQLVQCLSLPRNMVAANQVVAASPFAIENSTAALLRLYRNGVLP